MCGIFGILAPNADDEWVTRLVRRLFDQTDVRGRDASGIAYLVEDENGEPSTYYLKDAVAGARFADDKELIRILKEYTPKCLIGHCRAKTKGDESDPGNNHPIVSETTGICLVHNGRVQDYIWRATDDEDKNPYMLNSFSAEVDTEAIVQLLDTLLFIPRNEDGTIDPEVVAATPKEEWPKDRQVETLKAIDDAVFNLSGGQACALLDPDYPDTIFLWKVGNPIYLAWIPEQEALVFASTPEILKASLQETKVEYLFSFFEKKRETILPEFYGKEWPEKWATQITWQNDAPDNRIKFDSVALNPDGADIGTKSTKPLKVTAQQKEKEANVFD